jgi:hypothetical protein
MENKDLDLEILELVLIFLILVSMGALFYSFLGLFGLLCVLITIVASSLWGVVYGRRNSRK